MDTIDNNVLRSPHVNHAFTKFMNTTATSASSRNSRENKAMMIKLQIATKKMIQKYVWNIPDDNPAFSR